MARRPRTTTRRPPRPRRTRRTRPAPVRSTWTWEDIAALQAAIRFTSDRPEGGGFFDDW